MTQTFMEPATTDTPADLVRTSPCAAGYEWCEEKCEALDTADVDPDRIYHGCRYSSLEFQARADKGWSEMLASLYVRHDLTETPDAGPVILMTLDKRVDEVVMTAEQARANAAWLLNAADLIDPLPAGVMAVTAVQVRIGDELLTDDGWQRVTGLMFFEDTEQASVFTPQRGGEMDGTDGWDLSFNDAVKVRRPVHGSCAIQFVEPIQ